MGPAEAWAYRLDGCFCSFGGCLDLGDGKIVAFVVSRVKDLIKFVLNRVQIRTRNYNRNAPPENPTDWDEPRFGWIFILFMLNWVFSVSNTGHHGYLVRG